MFVDLINELVEHPVLGTGRVISQDNRRITIQFCEEADEKRFIYPDAFEKYLNMSNPAASQKVLADLTAKRKQIEEQQQKEEESDRKDMENVTLAAPIKKSTLKIKLPKAKVKADSKKTENSEMNDG